jgi:hypothetical protein
MNKKILELGVGNGAFLLSTAKFLDTKFKSELFNDPVEERRKIVQNNLYGVDFNSNAVEFCRNQLKSWIIGTNKADLRTNQNISINNVLNDNIRTGNILLGDILPSGVNDQSSPFIENMKDKKFKSKMGYFHWYEEFPHIFREQNPGFDLVLSNPPYVTKGIPAKDIRLYRRLYKEKIVVNRLNLYHLFFARTKYLLKPNGVAAFLTANSVLTDRFSSKLREFLLSNFQISMILDFVSRRSIFPNILQGTCILVLVHMDNNKSKYNTEVIRTFDLISLKNNLFEKQLIPIKKLVYYSKFIPSPFPSTFKILKILNMNSTKLKNLTKIQSGEIRPADEHIRPFYYKELPENASTSNFDIILNGKNIRPFNVNISPNRHKKRWYLEPDDNKKRLFRKDHARIPRIVFQRITAREQLRRVVAGAITKKDLEKCSRIWVENNINYILLDSSLFQGHLCEDSALGIFNSLLINWYLHQINLTAAIPPADLGLIPIPKEFPLKTEIRNELIACVKKLRNLLVQYPSSSRTLEALCPVCSSRNEIFTQRSKIDELVFNLYDVSVSEKDEILRQMSLHHEHFNHH